MRKNLVKRMFINKANIVTLTTLKNMINKDLIHDFIESIIPLAILIFLCINFKNAYVYLFFGLFFIAAIVSFIKCIRKYVTINKICDYITKEGIQDSNEKIVWSNQKDCVLTENHITIYKNGKIKCLKYSDIESVTREIKYIIGGRRVHEGELTEGMVFITFFTKNNEKIKIFMFSDDYVMYTPIYGITDIVPILQEKNSSIIVNDTIEHSTI